MTKEEYKALLKSDYWKGYSYSLIKERNFTCEDCGRIYYNERHKLQVHHLSYRDVSPWSYRPEELIVLCEECHKKRHGIITTINPPTVVAHSKSIIGNDASNTPTKSRQSKGIMIEHTRNVHSENLDGKRKFKNFLISFLLVFGMLLFVEYLVNRNSVTSSSTLDEKLIQNSNPKKEEVQPSYTISTKDVSGTLKSIGVPSQVKKSSPVVKKEQPSVTKTKLAPKNIESDVDKTIQKSLEGKVRVQTKDIETEPKNNSLDMLKDRTHANVVERARRVGVSTEGSTADILDRINHANIVEWAKREGVSSEGSTLEILERLNRKAMDKDN